MIKTTAEWPCSAGATLHGGDGDGYGDRFALPAKETKRSASKPSKQKVFLRMNRNFYPHMTLQQKPSDFDVIVQIYVKQCDTGVDAIGDLEEIMPLGEPRMCNLKDASAPELTQKAAFWRLQEIKVDLSDNSESDAGALLLQMAEAKAWGSSFARVGSSNCSAFFIPEPDRDAGVDDDDDACAKLLKAGLIFESKSNPRHFYITTKGAKQMQMRLLAGNEQTLEEYHRLPGYCFKCIIIIIIIIIMTYVFCFVQLFNQSNLLVFNLEVNKSS